MLNASDLQDRCQFGFFQANEKVLSAGFFGDEDDDGKDNKFKFTAVSNQPQTITVKIRYSKTTLKRKPLHGKLKITSWNSISNGWDTNGTCQVEDTDGDWTSTCTQNGDGGNYAMTNDGRTTDPTLCSNTLIIVFYVINGASFICLIVVNTIMIKRRCSSKKEEERNDIIGFVYNIALMSFFICYTFFVDKAHSGTYACYAIAGVTYWLLLMCIFIKMFQALDILEPYIAKGFLEKFYKLLVSWPFVIFASLVLSSGLSGAFGIFMTNFYKRDDNLCWIRSDYIVSGVILPMCHLGANAIIFMVLMLAITLGPVYKKEEKKKNKKHEDKEKKKGSPLKKTIFKALSGLTSQLILALPWLMQYLSLYGSSTNIFHYLFVVINGCQGMIQFVLLSLSQVFLNKSSDEKDEEDEEDEEDGESVWDVRF
uniref:Uncharacterized protein n=1 Tax=Acrobeloides nanus TaxID=290746 RepID=A0A914E332_9BILA